MYLLCPCHLDSQKPAQAKGAKMIPGSPENDTEKIGFIRFLHNRRWLFWKFLSLCGFVWFLQIFHTHETRSQGDKEMGREGDMETGRQGDQDALQGNHFSNNPHRGVLRQCDDKLHQRSTFFVVLHLDVLQLDCSNYPRL